MVCPQPANHEKFVVMLETHVAGGESMSRPQFAWHPNAAGIIAMAAHEDIFIAAIDAAATNGFQIAADSETHGVVAIGSFGTISSLSFSANGDRLAAVSSGTEVSKKD
jgi:hypothetical protein